MVSIQFNDQDTLDFEVAGYQFPQADDKDYDGNWLNIRLAVDSRVDKWETTDPSMLTWELEELVQQISQAAAKGLDGSMEVGFIEPNLRFYLAPVDNECIQVKVVFDAESTAPDWPDEKECSLKGRLNRETLKEIKAGLELEQKKYPKRI